MLREQDYVSDRSLAVPIYLALTLKRPLFLEGEAGMLDASVLASWELRGATGVIAGDAPETLPESSEFWVFSVWEFPQFGKRYDQLSNAQREALNDHWFKLRGLVQRYFNSHFVTPMA